MPIPSPLAFPPTALRNVTAGRLVGNAIGSSDERGDVLTAAELKAIVEASGISYLPLSGGTLTGSLTGTSITLAQGSLQSGGLSFSGAGGANIYGRGQMFVFGTANTNALEVAFDYARVARESWIGWSDGSYNASSNTVRVALFSDAVGTVNQRNALNAQCHVINKSYTSVSSQEALMLDAGKQIAGNLGLYSYRGASGGSNYPVRVGMLAADGTTFSGLTVGTDGAITAGVVSVTSLRQAGAASMSLTPADGIWYLNGSAGLRYRAVNLGLSTVFQVGDTGQLIWSPPSSITLSTNGHFSVEMTSNTAGNLVYRGSDGTTRRMALLFA